MQKTYEFYERQLGISEYEIQVIQGLLSKIENGTCTELDIRNLGEKGLKYCICEGKYDLFKKLVSPFSFKDKSGKRYYKYLLDPITLGIVEFINNCPESIMIAWARMNEEAKYQAELNHEEFFQMPVEYAAKYSIILYPSLKEELLNAIYKIDKEKIMSIRIKDVLPRQISGMGHPVRNTNDVIYYCETPVLYAGLDLFSKNIITTANDTEGCYGEEVENPLVCLNLDYESLDEENKIVADQLVQSGDAEYQDKSFVGEGKGINLLVSCSREDTVFEVNKKFMELVSKFHNQDMIYGSLSLDEVIDLMETHVRFLSDEELEKVREILNEGYTSKNVLNALEYFMYLNLYYDKEEDKFWIEEYYYRQHKSYLEEQPDFGGKGLK